MSYPNRPMLADVSQDGAKVAGRQVLLPFTPSLVSFPVPLNIPKRRLENRVIKNRQSNQFYRCHPDQPLVPINTRIIPKLIKTTLYQGICTAMVAIPKALTAINTTGPTNPRKAFILNADQPDRSLKK